MNSAVLLHVQDDTLDRLVAMTNETCLKALDRILWLRCAHKGDHLKALDLQERIMIAVHEIKLTLPT